jgi:broad specificity phosphatase PhoE
MRILSAFVGLVLVGCVSSGTTTIYAVRHAEKGSSPKDDPVLTEAGQKRAQDLAWLLRRAGVKAIYATPYLRNQQTARPLAEMLGLPVITVDATDIDGIVRRLKSDHPGQAVLFVGHANSLPAIVERLSGQAVMPIADNVYDNLFVITLERDGSASLKLRKY